MGYYNYTICRRVMQVIFAFIDKSSLPAGKRFFFLRSVLGHENIKLLFAIDAPHQVFELGNRVRTC